ncbi:MAG: type II secretion system F family protein [Bacillota bacterium]|nr:type II secretion system F family protein [Bacillota bacterium]
MRSLRRKGKGLAERGGKALLKLLPEWICGRPQTIEEKYRSRFGARDWGPQAERLRRRTLGSYLLLCLVFLLLLCLVLINKEGQSGAVEVLRLPERGEGAQTEELRGEAFWQGLQAEGDFSLLLSPPEMEEEEKTALLREFGETLPASILGKNESLQWVEWPLELPEKDPATGIRIQWESDRPELLSSEGKPALLDASGGELVRLTAVLSLGEAMSEKVISLWLAETPAKEALEEALEEKLQGAAAQLEEARGTDTVLELPEVLEPDISLRWERPQSRTLPLLVCIFLFSVLWVWFKRYDGVDKDVKAVTQSISRDFPEMVNKLVLLLNAGMVVRSALLKIADDYEKMPGPKESPLYEELGRIRRRAGSSNTPVVRELRDFAARSGVRELMRFAAIVGDNVDRGNTLAEKLEAESDLLWMGRKKLAEERGKLAEARLTFPLVILLLTLIMVTIAPALIGM